jgi:hypothetical protein
MAQRLTCANELSSALVHPGCAFRIILVVALIANSFGVPFTAGNLLVLEIFDAGGLTTTAASVRLTEISTAGAGVQAIPFSNLGAQACTLPGSQGAFNQGISGKLTLGAVGTTATFACINAPAGTTDAATDPNFVRASAAVYYDGSLSVNLLSFGVFGGRVVHCSVANADAADIYVGGPGNSVRSISYFDGLLDVPLSVVDSAKVSSTLRFKIGCTLLLKDDCFL